MSQAKVDRYKEEKKNRRQILKKQKMEKLLWKICGSAAVLLLVAWIGVSAFGRLYEPPRKMYEVDTTALEEYMDQLSADEAEE